MHILLEGIGGPQVNHIKEEISGNLRDPDGGFSKKVSQEHIDRDGKGNEQKDDTGQRGTGGIDLLQLAIEASDQALFHGFIPPAEESAPPLPPPSGRNKGMVATRLSYLSLYCMMASMNFLPVGPDTFSTSG